MHGDWYANCATIRGPVDWSFPSPTATPTHNSFGATAFHTPKTSSFPSHFQDAFGTPQFAGFTTPQPQYHPATTPVQRPQTSSDTLRSNYYANIQAVGNGQSMPPPGQHTPSGMAMISPTHGGVYESPSQMPLSQSFDSTQMQTPPPTRGTSVKRTQQPHEIAFGTPSTIASRRYMTPQQHVVPSNNAFQSQHTPVQFPHLHFSPDTYQFANFGPASAPVMPQSRVFWDSTGSPLQPMQSTLDDPFGSTLTSTMSWNNIESQQSGLQTAAFDTPVMHSFSVQAAQPDPAPDRSTTHDIRNAHETTSGGVDPSLLYSSPIRPIPRANGKPSKDKILSTSGDKQRKTANIKEHHRAEPSSSAETATNRSSSTLHRSKTTNNARAKGAITSLNGTEPIGRSNSVSQIMRTASPLKRFGRPSLGAISEGRPRQRASVVLTVDENGIARTETKRMEKSPTRSVRERYPALFDSDSSDTETDKSEQGLSRPSSFIFDKRDERKPKAARLDPPVENLIGLSLPRSGSAASMRQGVPPSRAAVAAAAQLRRQGSLRRSTPSRSSRRSLASSSSTSLIDSCPMDIPTDQTEHDSTQPPRNSNPGLLHETATFELPPPSAEGALDMYNRRWSMMSFEQQRPNAATISPPQHHYYPVQGSLHQTRPLQIRCICGVPHSNGQPLVQCYSCTQWLHTACVGLGNQPPPPGFTCFLCTKPPPRVLS